MRGLWPAASRERLAKLGKWSSLKDSLRVEMEMSLVSCGNDILGSRGGLAACKASAARCCRLGSSKLVDPWRCLPAGGAAAVEDRLSIPENMVLGDAAACRWPKCLAESGFVFIAGSRLFADKGVLIASSPGERNARGTRS